VDGESDRGSEHGFRVPAHRETVPARHGGAQPTSIVEWRNLLAEDRQLAFGSTGRQGPR
jgi:hypothetical protein